MLQCFESVFEIGETVAALGQVDESGTRLLPLQGPPPAQLSSTAKSSWQSILGVPGEKNHPCAGSYASQLIFLEYWQVLSSAMPHPTSAK